MPPGKLDEINARHAEECANVAQSETVDLPRRKGPIAAQTYRGLTDHQLAVTSTLTAGGPAVSVVELIERRAIGEIEGHGEHICRAIYTACPRHYQGEPRRF